MSGSFLDPPMESWNQIKLLLSRRCIVSFALMARSYKLLDSVGRIRKQGTGGKRREDNQGSLFLFASLRETLLKIVGRSHQPSHVSEPSLRPTSPVSDRVADEVGRLICRSSSRIGTCT